MEFTFLKTKKRISCRCLVPILLKLYCKKIVVELVKKKLNQSIPAYGPSLWRLGEFNKKNFKKKKKKRGTENNRKEKRY